jgi:hypothetical protein
VSESGDSLLWLALGGEYFCANPACPLHVREADPSVSGHGNWARFADGRIASRSRYGELMLCDVCGRHWLQSHPGESRI